MEAGDRTTAPSSAALTATGPPGGGGLTSHHHHQRSGSGGGPLQRATLARNTEALLAWFYEQVAGDMRMSQPDIPIMRCGIRHHTLYTFQYLQVVGAQDSVNATSSLVSRLRAEAELMDQDDER